MSHSGAGGATSTPSRDIMTQPPSSDPATTQLKPGASEEPAILALPVELQKTVVEHLTSYTDMKSACLVCKQLNVVVTPYLYRKMEITGEFLDSDGFAAAITTRNPGLSSVKTVRIVHPYPRSARIGRAACRLLSTIPRDSLTRFELPVPTSPRVARKIFDCVRRKQRKVDNHQYDSIRLKDRYDDEEAFAADIHYLAHIKHLRLCFYEEADARQTTIVLDSMHELTSVDVDLREVRYTANPTLLHLVFRAMSMNYQRPCIKSLRLDGVDFLHYGDTFPRLSRVRELKHLQLTSCVSYGPFLQMLTAFALRRSTDGDFLSWEMISPEPDELAHVTSLKIYFRVADFDHIDSASDVLARTPALRSLDLEFEELNVDDAFGDYDCALRVVEIIFCYHIKTGQTTRLESLRITSVCLLLVGELLTTVLELKDLKHLQLIRCTDIDPFLRKLELLRLSLSSLCIENCFQEGSTDFAVDDFIRSVKPLKRLTLKFDDTDIFDSETLRPHYSSLESLVFEGRPDLDRSELAGFQACSKFGTACIVRLQA